MRFFFFFNSLFLCTWSKRDEPVRIENVHSFLLWKKKPNKNELNRFILMQKSADCVNMLLFWKPDRKLPARITDKTFENTLEHRRMQVKVKVMEAFTSLYRLHSCSTQVYRKAQYKHSKFDLSAHQPVKTALNTLFTPVNK